MKIKLATADYSFPLLEWEKAVRLAGDLGMSGIDVSLFEGRSQLDPAAALANPARAGANARDTVRAHGMRVADVFGIPGRDFTELAPNHPDGAVRRASRNYFQKLIEFAASSEARHVTVLPGVVVDGEKLSTSFGRSAEELAWRRKIARDAGIELAFEAHTGSIVADPGLALRLLESVPGLTLTLDPAHFIAQGYGRETILPLVPYASHFHARCAAPGRLQAPLKQNVIDFEDLAKRLTQSGYHGWYAIEYVWIDWEHCNEVDNLSETILLRDVLKKAAEALA
ncbi:MAG TPA: sugar phosphate isomerase/epimerase family protein [Bryobacteraceae bacterium]|jgi:sugar phosphate isomerase/epimerase